MLVRSQVGAGLGISLRYVRQFTDKTAGRVVVKAGLAGLELELGATQRVSEFSAAGMGVSVGTQVAHAGLETSLLRAHRCAQPSADPMVPCSLLAGMLGCPSGRLYTCRAAGTVPFCSRCSPSMASGLPQ